jgi:hypothetical protein
MTPEQVIHDSLQEWNTEEFQRLGWNGEAAKRCVADLSRAGFSIVASTAAEDEVEAFIQAAIDTAPEPLQRLGTFLADVLDEDRWKTAEGMLLGIATDIPNKQSLLMRASSYLAANAAESGADELIRELMDALRRTTAVLPLARQTPLPDHQLADASHDGGHSPQP